MAVERMVMGDLAQGMSKAGEVATVKMAIRDAYGPGSLLSLFCVLGDMIMS